MTQLLNVESQRRDEILTQAADRQLPVVLSHRLDNSWNTYKSQILQADSSGNFLILAYPMHTPEEPPPELVPGEKIGVSFRRGHKKCMCSVEITRLTSFDPGTGQTIPAIRIPWPDKLQEMQRRLYYRAAVPQGRRIEVYLWNGCALDRDPADLRNVPHHVGLLLDVSAGGCRIIVEANRDPQLEEGDCVGLQFQPDPRSAPLVLDAMFRHAEDLPGAKRALGLQFVGLETSPKGQHMLQALSRVVSTFLRIELRRQKNRSPKHRRRRQTDSQPG